MTMPLPPMKIKQGEAKSYPPLPEDVYQVELLDITLKEVDNSKYGKQGETQEVFSFQFTIVEEGDLRCRNIWRDYVPTELYVSKKGKNLLYQIIEAMIMRDLKPEELDMMDSEYINKLIGFQCRVAVKNHVKDGEKRSFIDSFLPKKGTLPKLTEEEKENCRVKVETTSTPRTSVDRSSAQPAPDDEIPTINLDDDLEPPAPSIEEEKDEIKIEEVPF